MGAKMWKDGGREIFHFDGKAMDYGGSHTTNYIIPLRSLSFALTTAT